MSIWSGRIVPFLQRLLRKLAVLSALLQSGNWIRLAPIHQAPADLIGRPVNSRRDCHSEVQGFSHEALFHTGRLLACSSHRRPRSRIADPAREGRPLEPDDVVGLL